MLAIIYEQGLGVDKDPKRARHYYLACKNGYKKSCTHANAN
ncbi:MULTISPECIES: SEL1-like repeat protein [unclassified Gilliamella]|nr:MULTISPECIES: SEL1-like repeat protein [unclassified Gilliamella]